MLLVMIGWVFFRAADVGAAFKMLAAMAGLSGWAMSPALEWQVAPERLLVMFFGVIFAFALPWVRQKVDGHPVRLLLVPLFLWAVATLSSQAFTPFLYFQF
jgi:alginate O-acetyltransferase complex protein AlgI